MLLALSAWGKKKFICPVHIYIYIYIYIKQDRTEFFSSIFDFFQKFDHIYIYIYINQERIRTGD